MPDDPRKFFAAALLAAPALFGCSGSSTDGTSAAIDSSASSSGTPSVASPSSTAPGVGGCGGAGCVPGGPTAPIGGGTTPIDTPNTPTPVGNGGTDPSGGGSGPVTPTVGGSGPGPVTTPVGNGGTTSMGGTGNSACTNVRPTGTDWDEATCEDWASQSSECSAAWMVDNHWCDESCGRCVGSGTGGTPNSGTPNSGGTGNTGSGPEPEPQPGPTPTMCSEADGEVCGNEIGNHCGYTYEYWKDQGTGCLTNRADGFSVEWNDINNLLGRKGIRPGSSSNVVTYDADYQPDGNSYLCVYGWSRGPLVEYYIVDSWGTWRPPGGEGFMGTVTSDGATYDIYRTERVNQPSIDGTQTFYQYWSVRQDKRTSGTITVANHFDAWASLGMNMGSLYEVSMTVEGYQSSGTADVTVSIE